MTSIPVYQEGLQYTDEVRNAVRYGYRYRKEAEVQETKASHACLGPESEILLWLAKLILDGIAWDIIKVSAKSLSNLIRKPLEQQLNSLLNDEEYLREFYDDIKEFNEQRMAVTEKQFQYIREEICADYHAKEVTQIFEQEQRLPTHEEYLRIFHEGQALADKLMNPIRM